MAKRGWNSLSFCCSSLVLHLREGLIPLLGWFVLSICYLMSYSCFVSGLLYLRLPDISDRVDRDVTYFIVEWRGTTTEFLSFLFNCFWYIGREDP